MDAIVQSAWGQVAEENRFSYIFYASIVGAFFLFVFVLVCFYNCTQICQKGPQYLDSLVAGYVAWKTPAAQPVPAPAQPVPAPAQPVPPAAQPVPPAAQPVPPAAQPVPPAAQPVPPAAPVARPKKRLASLRRKLHQYQYALPVVFIFAHYQGFLRTPALIMYQLGYVLYISLPNRPASKGVKVYRWKYRLLQVAEMVTFSLLYLSAHFLWEEEAKEQRLVVATSRMIPEVKVCSQVFAWKLVAPAIRCIDECEASVSLLLSRAVPLPAPIRRAGTCLRKATTGPYFLLDLDTICQIMQYDQYTDTPLRVCLEKPLPNFGHCLFLFTAAASFVAFVRLRATVSFYV